MVHEPNAGFLPSFANQNVSDFRRLSEQWIAFYTRRILTINYRGDSLEY